MFHFLILSLFFILCQLQVLLNDYLDIRNTTSRTGTSTNFDAPTTDVGAYFAKKRPNKPKKVTGPSFLIKI